MYIHEIFESISGEVASFPQGSKAIFVRFAGCNLSCDFCDAPEARTIEHALIMTPEQIMEAIPKYGTSKKIIITGGEPLWQKDIHTFIDLLVTEGYEISIETNGTLFYPSKAVSLVVDYKLEIEQELKMNQIMFSQLHNTDYIKFVVTWDTLEKALQVQQKITDMYTNINNIPVFAYSPMIPLKIPVEAQLFIMQRLSHKIMKGLQSANLHGVINVQLHKLLNFV